MSTLYNFIVRAMQEGYTFSCQRGKEWYNITSSNNNICCTIPNGSIKNIGNLFAINIYGSIDRVVMPNKNILFVFVDGYSITLKATNNTKRTLRALQLFFQNNY